MNRFIEEMMSRWWPFYQPLAALPSYTWEKVEEKKIEERRALESHNTEYFTKIQNDATVSGGKKSVCVCVSPPRIQTVLTCNILVVLSNSIPGFSHTRAHTEHWGWVFFILITLYYFSRSSKAERSFGFERRNTWGENSFASYSAFIQQRVIHED